MATANTREAVRELIGKKIVGVLFDALPLNRADLRSGNKTLVFEDGTGFTFNTNGAYWNENAEDVKRAVQAVEKSLSDTQRELRGVRKLAGHVAAVQGSSDTEANDG